MKCPFKQKLSNGEVICQLAIKVMDEGNYKDSYGYTVIEKKQCVNEENCPIAYYFFTGK